MDHIPDKIVLKIIGQLPTSDLAVSVSKVSVRLSNMVSDSTLWINPDIGIKQVWDSTNHT
jgi:hypothetical protein